MINLALRWPYFIKDTSLGTKFFTTLYLNAYQTPHMVIAHPFQWLTMHIVVLQPKCPRIHDSVHKIFDKAFFYAIMANPRCRGTNNLVGNIWESSKRTITTTSAHNHLATYINLNLNHPIFAKYQKLAIKTNSRCSVHIRVELKLPKTSRTCWINKRMCRQPHSSFTQSRSPLNLLNSTKMHENLQ